MMGFIARHTQAGKIFCILSGKNHSTAVEKYFVRTALGPTEREEKRIIMPPEKSSHESTVGRLRDIPLSHKDIRCRHEVIPDATSPHLGWVGLQAFVSQLDS
jgi:hypothetical protein